ncbi:hypothetical protein [Bartonella sp. DGB1]
MKLKVILGALIVLLIFGFINLPLQEKKYEITNECIIDGVTVC